VIRLPDKTGQCLVCGKRFSYVDSARRHYNLVHVARSDQSVTCHVCSGQFRNLIYLRNHLRTSHGIFQRDMAANS
jgi:hypothetical protein